MHDRPIEEPPMIGIVTVSDTRTHETDLSGPAVEEALRDLGFVEFERMIVPDRVDAIRQAILGLAPICAAVFTTGGTGFAPTDVTPEATAPLLQRRADSLMELIRLRGLEHTPMSHLSRGVAGIVDSALIVNLPGSPKGARQGIEAIAPLLPSILSSLAGDGCVAHELKPVP